MPATVRRVNHNIPWPLTGSLVINQDIRLAKKSCKTLLNAELLRTIAGILQTARTPAIKNRPVRMKFTNVLDNRRYRNTFTARATN